MPASAEDIFHAARELPRDQRDAFLEQACGADHELRGMVEELLKADSDAGSFMDWAPPTVEGSAAAAAQPPHEQPGDQFGRYKLLQELGQGGFGTVWMAEQVEPVQRRVALKIIKLGMDTRQVIARFEAERQALALMEHPNIAKVLDAGATDSGRPFFVMELVRGVPITEFCDANRLPTAERLQIFYDVCGAVHHAHQKGVIHRDLKPSNILITLHDGRPVPKVIDFGIAKATNQKLTEKTLFTEHQQMIGTPQYMSPEQAEMSGLDVDSRSDIYSLGVLLYELLTGTAPLESEELRSAGYARMQEMIREVDPPRPSQRLSTLGQRLPTVARQRRIEPGSLSRLVRGELDWIVMKALEKDRRRRYDSAAQFAADVQRYLKREPVEAAPPQMLYRFRKFALRYRAVVAATTVGLIALTLGAGFATYFAIQAQHSLRQLRISEQEAHEGRMLAQQAAERAAAQAAENAHLLYTKLIRTAQTAIENGGAELALDLLEKTPPEQRGWEWGWLQRLAADHGQSLGAHERDGIRSIAYSPDGRRIVSGGYDFVARVWDADLAEELMALRGHQAVVTGVSFSPDGRRIATCSADRTVRLWDAEDGRNIETLLGHDAWLAAVAFDPTGRWLASCGGNSNLRIWNADTFELVHEMGGYPHDVWGLDFSPDGEQLATSTGDGQIVVWNTGDGEQAWQARVGNFGCWTIRYSPDGTRLAVGGFDNRATVWDAQTGQQQLELTGHNLPVRIAEFTPDGATIVTGSSGVLRSFDASSGAPLATRLSSQFDLHAFDFHPSGERFALGGETPDVRVWSTAAVSGPLELFGHRHLVFESVPAPDGRTLYSVAQDGTLRAWDAVTGENQWTRYRAGGFASIDITPDGTRLVTAGGAGLLDVWDPRTGKPVWSRKVSRGIRNVSVSPDGDWVVAGAPRTTPDDDTPTLAVWNLENGTTQQLLTGHRKDTRRMAFSRDGQRFASTSLEAGVIIWDPGDGSLLHRLPFDEDRAPNSIVFSQDGSRLFVGDYFGRVTCWDVATGELLFEFMAHNAVIGAIELTVDGRRLLTAAWHNPQVRLWNADTGDLLMEFETGISGLSDAGFLPGDRGLLAAGMDGGLRSWEMEVPVGADALRRETGRRMQQRMQRERQEEQRIEAAIDAALELRRTGHADKCVHTLERLAGSDSHALPADHPLLVRLQRELEWTRPYLRVMQSPPSVDAQQLERLAGTYAERSFAVVEGALVYRHEVYDVAHQLMPLGPLTFYTPDIDGFRLEFVLEDERPVMVRGLYSNGTSDESTRNPD